MPQSSSAAAAARPVRPRHRWRGPLLAGFCFGLGYGITQRLLVLQLPGLVQLQQGFDVREFPGTSLESLRLRFGSDNEEIRGDLELLELERQAKQREQERQAAEREQAAERQRDERQAEQERALQTLPEIPPLNPAADPGADATPEPDSSPPPAPALPEPSP
ncbi:hypothetical protein [Cyanobium sp. LEGE 06113]|uniref:hypothetical protein n=1 Tax=Cyanobium sp. LEGE 06113 TaxID=1297573 RepID=UPI00187FBD45|nr:hypothetical protein [Cyanobium sp. LEGE 06113]MBE9154361.1 hypothetical protein [Cyanobium sp. LEGE 06113]